MNKYIFHCICQGVGGITFYVAYIYEFMLEWMEKYVEQKKLEDENEWANIYIDMVKKTTQGLPTRHKIKWP